MHNMAIMEKFGGMNPEMFGGIMQTLMGGTPPANFMSMLNPKAPQTRSNLLGQNGHGMAPSPSGSSAMMGMNGAGRPPASFGSQGMMGQNGGGQQMLGAAAAAAPMLGASRGPMLGASGGQLDAPFQNSGGFSSLVPGIGQIAQGIGGMFMPNPADSAMPYLDRADAGNRNLDPYSRAGRGILDPWSDELQRIMSDPSGRMNEFGADYQQSPGYQFQVDEATKRANQSAAAGGYVGSPAAQAELANTINGLASQDYYKYLDNVLGLYGQGLSGAQGLAGIGSNAASQMAQNEYNKAIAQAQLAYAGQANQNQAFGGGIGNIIGGGLSLFGY